MAVAYPVIGKWFRCRGANTFEVVAVDEDDGTIEIQHFDGTIEEVDFEFWPDLLSVEVSAPEDSSGSVDMDPDDYVGRKEGDMPPGFHDALDFLKEPE
jgi:hypothetical protein